MRPSWEAPVVAGVGLSSSSLLSDRRGRDVAVEAEEVVRVVAVLELYQTLPVLRRVGGARPLRIPVAQDEEVDEGGAGFVRAHLIGYESQVLLKTLRHLRRLLGRRAEPNPVHEEPGVAPADGAQVSGWSC